MAATAETDRHQIRHAEQGAHAADLDHGIGFARKAVAQLADIAGGAADVHHHDVFQPGEMRRAAHRIGGAGGKAHHREGDGGFGLHHGAVVLGQEQRGVDAALRGRLAEGRHRLNGEVVQHRIEQRRVLPLQQADPSQIGRQGHGDIRADLPQDIARRHLAARIERREDRGNRHRAQTLVADAPRRRAHAGGVERHDRAAVIIVATLEQEGLAVHPLGEILRPIAERRQRCARRHADPDRRHLHQMPPLHHGVDEMRGADDDGVHRGARRGIGAQGP